MREYNLINPNEPYTFLADDLETAALTAFVFGREFSARAIQTAKDTAWFQADNEVPHIRFDLTGEWYHQHFGRSLQAGMKAKQTNVAEALDSFLLGDHKNRKRFEKASKNMNEKEKEEFREAWQNGHQSIVDIGGLAYKLAKAMRTYPGRLQFFV